MSSMISAPRMSGHLGDCGCSDCKGECCELECLVQPRFFCGQLLTDQDLSTMLEWVKGKTALARYRHGWGAVCGLEVHCNAKTGEQATVSVMPGYAIDCCGNDVVVCEEARIDLSQYCKPEEDPCGDWPPPPKQPGQGMTDNATISFGGWQIPKAEVQAVDLFVRYAETVSDARTALARGGCKPAETCEYTRTHEGYELYAKKAEYCDQFIERRAIDWEETYRKGLKELFGNIKDEFSPADQRAMLESLSYWIRHNPLHSFCFIREWLCDLQRSNTPLDQKTYSQLIFWLIQDWRNNYFRCDCYGCGPDAGVPLARVWLWRQRLDGGKFTCKVIFINSYPPFRRAMENECWPAQPGSVSLARFIWQPVDYVFTELRNLGFEEITTERFAFNTVMKLKEQLGNDQLFVPQMDRRSTNSLVIYFYDDNCEQRRVVSFEVGPRPVRPAVEPNTLPPDDPVLDVRRVPGIGDGIAHRLKTKGIQNLRDLGAATPTAVKEALSTIPINPPNEARSQLYINEARDLLDKLKKGT